MTRCSSCPRSTRRRYARFCDACRWPRRLKTKKYVWTDEKDAFLRARYNSAVRGRAAQIGEVWGWPKWVIGRRAQQLGLAKTTLLTEARPWTAEEIAFLEKHAGRRHPNWLRLKLKRSLTSVVVKLKRLRLSRLPEGYSVLDVASAFGVERGTVERWLRLGLLRPNFVPMAGQPYRITDAELLAFVRLHPRAFDLAKVEQVWFLDLVLSGDRRKGSGSVGDFTLRITRRSCRPTADDRRQRDKKASGLGSC